MVKRIICILMVIAGFCFAAGCGQEQQQAPPSVGLMKGQLAPDFTIQDIDGKEFTLSSLRNKSNVLLVFWATWCPYCIQEVPKLKKLHSKYDAKDLKIISINVASNDPLPRVKAAQQKLGMPYPILYDKTNIVSRMYGVQGIPVSIVIDRKGTIQFRGFQMPETIDALFDQLIKAG